MKKILFLLITLSATVVTFAQGNFKVENGELVWETEIAKANADIVPILDREPSLKVTGLMDNIYKGAAYEITPNCPEGSALLKNNCKFEFMMVVNPDTYIVKVKALKLLEHYGPMGARIMANNAEKYYVEGGHLKTDADTVHDLSCLDRYFTAMFTLPAIQQQDAITAN